MSSTLPTRYSRYSVLLHWLMLAVIALAVFFVETRIFFERGTPERAFFRAAHFSMGLLVLALVAVRLVARLRGGTPPIVPAPPPLQRALSHAVHALLYLLMFGMPLAGWFILSLRGDPIPFFGLQLPPLAAPDEDLAKFIRGWHGDIGRVFYGLIGLHAAAALFHHYKLGDNTLRRMLPGR